MRRKRPHAVLLAIALLSAPAARAELPPPSPSALTPAWDRDSARQKFSEASALAKREEWSAALSLYRDSFALYPHATTLFNVGFCLGEIGDLLAALRVTSAALDQGRFDADRGLQPERRRVAEVQVVALRAQLAQIHLSGGEALAVMVDGARSLPLGGASPATHVPERAPLPELVGYEVERVSEPVRTVVVLPGHRRVTVQTTHGPRSFDVSLRAGERAELELTPPSSVAAAPAAPAAPAKAPQRAAPAERSHPLSWRNTAGFGALAVGGAGLGLAAAFGVLARNADARLAEACSPELSCGPEQQDTIQRYERSVAWANVGLITGLVGVSAGVSILLLVPSSQPEAKTALSIAPSSVTLRHSF